MFTPLPRVAPASTLRSNINFALRQLPSASAWVPVLPTRCSSSSTSAKKEITLLQDKKNGFGFARSNPRPPKPRTKGVTEIRGPYYTVCRSPSRNP
ncbi:hypothetical protein ASPACDRAFT_120974 [Aspergillus aculeatus ATCC 16872]|uniref:Uncharacterized protein n=1 Tax=Aspergillus aculeatus (strain ATCC 16872 / CBS 172.66 / WB 5094) TaxID=690307 RepID=A0A1L9WTJ0_ASPA1|nr:uncharacterized protein ASPACDRAFT_120974 [Aspergillus aculeatus ATCC 16872]OJJ99495.1 hypothetical protein ASPACDRAFT_120974 [Aspergillus aculeatus ATCC 16872]